MKPWIKATLWSVFGIGIVFLLVSVRSTLQSMEVPEPEIHITVDGENAFLTEKELLGRLRRQNLLFAEQRFDQLQLQKIEDAIRAMHEVKKVRVYDQIGPYWNIDLELRKPIARVFNNLGQNYYLDADGTIMETSIAHHARVVAITGNIPDPINSPSVNDIINNDTLKSIHLLDEMYRISNYVCTDPVMQSLIGQIHRERNGDFVLIPIVGDQRIIFGSANTSEEVEQKFEKLKIFYKEAIPYEGWNKYSEISLKYREQIVCKKKE